MDNVNFLMGNKENLDNVLHQNGAIYITKDSNELYYYDQQLIQLGNQDNISFNVQFNITFGGEQ